MQLLVGRSLPDVELPSSNGANFNPRHEVGQAVYFCYPYTGRPGVSDPRGWDDIAGAHGSTPQALAYAAQYPKFRDRRVSIFGVSLLSQEWIADFKQLNSLPYELLSDADGLFSHELKLERFQIDGVDYLQRITLVAMDGVIVEVIFPVTMPSKDAAQVLALLK